MTIAFRFAPALALVLALGCDLALVPETASYEGTSAPRLALQVVGEARTAAGVQAVDLELVDALVHRESDDAWVWIGGSDERLALGATLVATNLPVPLPADRYDALRLVLESPRVAHGNAWHRATLATDTIELALDLDLDGDHALALHFDLARSLAGSRAGAWRFDPSVYVTSSR